MRRRRGLVVERRRDSIVRMGALFCPSRASFGSQLSLSDAKEMLQTRHIQREERKEKEKKRTWPPRKVSPCKQSMQAELEELVCFFCRREIRARSCSLPLVGSLLFREEEQESVQHGRRLAAASSESGNSGGEALLASTEREKKFGEERGECETRRERLSLFRLFALKKTKFTS